MFSAPTTSWTPAGTGIPDVPVNAMTIDPADPLILWVGTDVGVFQTVDGGVSWFPFSLGLPRVAVFDLSVQGSTERVLRAATHGRGIWEFPISSDSMPFLDGFETGDTTRWSATQN